MKLHFRVIPKSYKGGRRVYSHEEVTLNFPKDLHELLRFCGIRELKLGVSGKGTRCIWNSGPKKIRDTSPEAESLVLAKFFVLSPLCMSFV